MHFGILNEAIFLAKKLFLQLWELSFLYQTPSPVIPGSSSVIYHFFSLVIIFPTLKSNPSFVHKTDTTLSSEVPSHTRPRWCAAMPNKLEQRGFGWRQQTL